MKYIKLTITWIIKQVVSVLKGCFYLFSAYTLVMVGLFLLYIAAWLLDIHGLKEKVILYGYLFFVGIYAAVKSVLWVVNLYKRLRTFYRRFFPQKEVK